VSADRCDSFKSPDPDNKDITEFFAQEHTLEKNSVWRQIEATATAAANRYNDWSKNEIRKSIGERFPKVLASIIFVYFDDECLFNHWFFPKIILGEQLSSVYEKYSALQYRLQRDASPPATTITKVEPVEEEDACDSDDQERGGYMSDFDDLDRRYY